MNLLRLQFQDAKILSKTFRAVISLGERAQEHLRSRVSATRFFGILVSLHSLDMINRYVILLYMEF